MSLSPERRASLAAAKLAALADALGAPSTRVPVAFAAGAALVDQDKAWLLVLESARLVDPMDMAASAAPKLPRGWVGAVELWCQRHNIAEAAVIADTMDANGARRLGHLERAVSAWRVVGREAVAVDPCPVEVAPQPPADHLGFVGMIDAAGAILSVEYGVVLAEVDGLEVGRVEVPRYEVPRYEVPSYRGATDDASGVDDRTGPVNANGTDSGAGPDGRSAADFRTGTDSGADPDRAGAENAEPVLLVGVGRHDRLAIEMLYGDANALPVIEMSGISAPATNATTDVLAQVVAVIQELRRPGAAPHPANLLRRDRWLREVVLRDPSKVGATELHPVAGLQPPSLKGAALAAAVGIGTDGSPVLVGCGAGTDLDAPIDLIDTALREGLGDARLTLAVASDDDATIIRRLCAALRADIVVTTLAPPWSL